MNEYLLKIRGIIDLLDLVGQKLTAQEHIDSVFNGLPEEYENFITHFDMLKQESRVEG